jgi:hypothetical protein
MLLKIMTFFCLSEANVSKILRKVSTPDFSRNTQRIMEFKALFTMAVHATAGNIFQTTEKGLELTDFEIGPFADNYGDNPGQNRLRFAQFIAIHFGKYNGELLTRYPDSFEEIRIAEPEEILEALEITKPGELSMNDLILFGTSIQTDDRFRNFTRVVIPDPDETSNWFMEDRIPTWLGNSLDWMEPGHDYIGPKKEQYTSGFIGTNSEYIMQHGVPAPTETPSVPAHFDQADYCWVSPTTQTQQATLDTGMDFADDEVTRIEERAIVTDKAVWEPSALTTLIMAMNAKLDHLLQHLTGGGSELPSPTSGNTLATISTATDEAATLTDHTDCTDYTNYTDCTDCTHYTDYTDCTDYNDYTVDTDFTDVVALFASALPAAIYDG